MRCVKADEAFFKGAMAFGTVLIVVATLAMLIGGYGLGRAIAFDILIAVVCYGFGIASKFTLKGKMWDTKTGEIWDTDYTPTIKITKKNEDDD